MADPVVVLRLPARAGVNLAALHPIHLAGGLGIAAAALLADWRRPGAAGSVAALGAAMWLALWAQVPPTTALAVALVAATAVLPIRWRLPIAVGASVLLLVARPHAPAAGVALLGAGAAGVLLAGRRAGDATGWWRAGMVAAAAAGSFLGAPDTEGAVVMAAALVPSLLLGRPAPAIGRPWAPLLLAAWVCVDGYRGRPAGLSAALVTLAAVVVVAAAAPRCIGPVRSSRAAAAGLVVATVAVVAAARSIGLHQAVRWTDLLVAAALAGTVAAAGTLSVGRAPVRTPGG